jgi:hypothetical protein
LLGVAVDQAGFSFLCKCSFYAVHFPYHSAHSCAWRRGNNGNKSGDLFQQYACASGGGRPRHPAETCSSNILSTTGVS